MTRRSTTRGRDGDHLVVDDRTGFTEWASDCVKEWNGLLVHKRVYETRHPQDFIRARREDWRIPDARPQRALADEPYAGPLITTATASTEVGDNSRYAPMGPLGAFAIGAPEQSLRPTLSNVAGSFFLSVVSTTGMTEDDTLSVILDSGDVHLTSIVTVLGATGLEILAALPAPVSAGNLVTDISRTGS